MPSRYQQTPVMALNATIIKAELHVADMDRHYYQQHNLTLAQHPSETAERLVLRLLVFALHANEFLAFTKGLSTDDEPDLWQKSLTGDIELWIELGQPSDKRIRKACGRAQRVVIYSYGRSADPWWKQQQPQLTRFDNLSVFHVPQDILKSLATFYSRNINAQVNIQDGEITFHCNGESVGVVMEKLT
jgi:uncharacterized protein YaeQ